MAKGYPAPRERELDLDAGFELPKNVCMICKRHPAERAGMCASCDAVLSADSA